MFQGCRVVPLGFEIVFKTVGVTTLLLIGATLGRRPFRGTSFSVQPLSP